MARPSVDLTEILDNLCDGVYFVDRERQITYWNRGAQRISGYAADAMVGRNCYDNLLAHTDHSGCQLCHGECPLVACIKDGQMHVQEVYLRHKDGQRVPVEVRVAPCRNGNGEIVGAVETFTDISQKMSALERVKDLEKVALVDELTGVANRRFLEQTLQMRWNEFQRYAWAFGVLFIDLDNFKAINDSLGHAAGDEVLKVVSRTIANCMRSFDLIGRWGGDEFLVILANTDTSALTSIANRLCSLVCKSRLPESFPDIPFTLSIGGSVITHGEALPSLLARADQMLYRSKSQGRNQFSIG